MPRSSLYEMSMRACIKNIWSIEGVGDMLYSQIKPLLSRVQTADQLRRIEENSPQIMGETAELWKKLIARDVPTWEKKNYAPKNPENWYKIYKLYIKEQKEEILRDQEKLRETMMGIKSKRDQNSSQLVNLKSVVLPRDPRMRVGDGARRPNGGGAKKDMSKLNFNSGSKTKMVDGKSVLNRARKEAREIHAMGRLNKLTHTLAGNSSQVKKAPEGMRREYEIALQPALPAMSRVFMTKRKTGSIGTHSSSKLQNDLDEREARLRRAMQPSGASRKIEDEPRGKKRTVIDSTDEEGGHDDLFDESPPKRTKFASPPVTQTTKPKPVTASKPSDLISKMLAMKKSSPVVTKPQSKPLVDNQKPITTSKPPAPISKPLGSSPAPPTRRISPPVLANKQAPPPPGMVRPRKKKEVDIFNRKAMRRPPQK